MLNCAEPFDFRECDGFAEAVARESQIRGAACLGINEVICGLEVKPLCPAHMGLLSFVNYPFHGGYTVAQLCGTKEKNFADGKPDLVTDILRFLWIVSPMYQTGSVCGKQVVPPPCPKRRLFERGKKYSARVMAASKKYYADVEAAKTARDRFNEAFAPILNQRIDVVVSEILNYVEEAFIDFDDSAPASAKQYNAMQISVADELHQHYGYRIDVWNPGCPADKNPILVPLKIIGQLRKCRANKAGAEIKNRSDKFVQAGLEKMAQEAAIRRRLSDPNGVNACFGIN